MTRHTLYVSICAISCWTCAQKQPYTINMFIHDYPEEELKNHPRHIDQYNVTKQVMKTQFYQPVELGVYGLYNGYLARTNDIGLLSFPRATQQEQFTLVVTQAIKPIFLLDNTIENWTLAQPDQTAMFQIKRLKDPETKILYWKVQELNIPTDNYIPIHSIIIIAKPEDVYMPLGATPTTKLPNLVLPPIYVKRGLDRIHQALFVLQIKHFFSPVRMTNKQDQLSRSTLMIQ